MSDDAGENAHGCGLQERRRAAAAGAMMDAVTIHHGDMREVLQQLPAASVDACVTDPPYGLAFMGSAWDRAVPGQAYWRAVHRVLRPGGHLLAFGGSRTVHRLGVAIEDAGFEIRDRVWNLAASDAGVAAFLDSLSDVQAEALGRLIDAESFGGLLGWLFGSGFPKSLDVAKDIDRAGGDAQAARRWAGWGTALKPAIEPIVVARKPLDGTVVDTVLRHGTGALNVDGCRIGVGDDRASGGATGRRRRPEQGYGGRWPANVVLDGSDEVRAMFPQEAGAAAPVRGSEPSSPYGGHVYGERRRTASPFHGDGGSAARFFYTAKAGRLDRVVSCTACGVRGFGPPGCGCMVGGRPAETRSHPTVKPVALLRWLVRLVTPPGGIVLDPFAGTGATGVAAAAEGFRAILVEREAEYAADARWRIDHIAGLDAPLLADASRDDAAAPGQQLGLEGMG